MRISDWSSDVCSSDLIGDEAQAMHIRWRIIAITAVAPRRRRHQPDLLVMADHPLGDPARFRGMARSEERRVGKECVSTCRSRWSPVNYKQIHNIIVAINTSVYRHNQHAIIRQR